MSRRSINRRREIVEVLGDVRLVTCGQIREYLSDGNVSKANSVIHRWKKAGLVGGEKHHFPDGVMETVYFLGKVGVGEATKILGIERFKVSKKLRPSSYSHQVAVAEVYFKTFAGENTDARRALRGRVEYRDSARSWIELGVGTKKKRLGPDAFLDCPETGNTIYLEVDQGTKALRLIEANFERYSSFFRLDFDGRHPGRTPVLLYVVPMESRRKKLEDIWKKKGKTKFLPLRVVVGAEEAARSVRGWAFSGPEAEPGHAVSADSELQALTTIRSFLDLIGPRIVGTGIDLSGMPEAEKMNAAVSVLNRMIDDRRN